MERKFGFTLAEMFITIAIVGVVSALTIPVLVTNYQANVRIAQLQKVYNEISGAIVAAIADERTDALDYTYVYEDVDGAVDFLSKYLKVSSRCNSSECMAPTYRSLDGTASGSIFQNSVPCVTLNMGAVVCVPSIQHDDGYNGHSGMSVVIDVNGQNAPNTNGRDLFQFVVYSDGSIGNSYQPQSNGASAGRCEQFADKASYAGSCFSKIVADGWKMDY